MKYTNTLRKMRKAYTNYLHKSLFSSNGIYVLISHFETLFEITSHNEIYVLMSHFEIAF